MNVWRVTGALVLASLALPVTAQQIQIDQKNKTIAVSASDQAARLADTAVLTVGFRLYGKDQDATYADASRTSNAIMSALSSAGVPKDAVQSVNQSLSALEANSPADRARYDQGVRFLFFQSWHVTVPAAVVADVLHTAILAGANESGAIQWQLKQDNALEAEAAKKALEHARQIATGMAEGLGVKLGPLVYAGNQAPSSGLSPFDQGLGLGSGGNYGAGVYRRNLLPLAISPEKITRSATVYAVFAIE